MTAMKTAKIMIRTISLICPECRAVVSEGRHGANLLRDDVVADRWEELSHKDWKCSNCHKHFKLPPNPFTIREKQQNEGVTTDGTGPQTT